MNNRQILLLRTVPTEEPGMSPTYYLENRSAVSQASYPPEPPDPIDCRLLLLGGQLW